jgi:hypothetical protein
MAVLLDGPAWARRRTVGDRDGLPVEVLGGLLRWPVVERVWLPSWLADPGTVLDRLTAALRGEQPADEVPWYDDALRPPVADLAADPDRDAAEPPPTPLPVQAGAPGAETYRGVAALRAVVTEKVAAPVPAPSSPDRPSSRAGSRSSRRSGPVLDGETEFSAYAPKMAGDRAVLEALPASAAARTVRRVLSAGVKAEGPVQADRLVKLAAGAFGVSRLGEARKSAVLATLPPSAVDDDGWLWPDDVDPASWSGFRRQATSGERPLDQVHPLEVANAMAALCRAADDPLPREDLLTAAAAVFGHRRRTPATTPRLEAALGTALDTGRLVEDDDGRLTTPSSDS